MNPTNALRTWKANELLRSPLKRIDKFDRVAIAAFVLLVISFLIGGASQKHELRLSLVELAALPLIGLAILRVWDTGVWAHHRFAISLLLAVIAVPLVQLVPLPPEIWTSLPRREEGLLAIELAGLSPGWVPISIAPDMTWRSFLSALPAAAIFLATLVTSSSAHRAFVYLVFSALILSFLFGMAQLAFGSPAYPWPTTTHGTVAGLFANRNHLATLCLVSLPLAAATIVVAARRSSNSRAIFFTGIAIVAVSIITLAATRSRAGVGLSGPALILAAMVVAMAVGRYRPGPASFGLAGSAGAALILVAVLGGGPILDRFDSAAPQEARFERWPTVAEVSQAHQPVGAGFGTFERVYRSVETLEELDATSFNRAHNDYLETWLEGGWISVGIFSAFIIWFGRRSWAVWRAPNSSLAHIGRAASAGLLIILLHSFVDYPLRTVSIMTLFALLAGILESFVARSNSAPV